MATLMAGLASLVPTLARAQIGSDRYSSIIVEAATGNVLEAANADAPRHPASLAKLMTLYMAFEALRDRRITLDGLVPVSAHAASMQPSKLGITPGTRITVEEAILGLVTKSANDVAAALGEMLGGSEERFAQMMTLRGRALGMSRTTFTNASGLPDPDQWTSARDMAVLARHLLADFPGYYPYFSTRSFTFRRRVIFNHDRMLEVLPWRRRHEDRLHRVPRGTTWSPAPRAAAYGWSASCWAQRRTPSATPTWPRCSIRASSSWTCQRSAGPWSRAVCPAWSVQRTPLHWPTNPSARPHIPGRPRPQASGASRSAALPAKAPRGLPR